MNMIYVQKLNGEKQAFSEQKLTRSLERAGASKELSSQILLKIKKSLYDGISTREIFTLAFREFKKNAPMEAPRYDLKNSLMRLGLTGFPFEDFIAKVLERKGYKTKLNQIIKGKFVQHEIDVSAIKNNEKLLVEAKHHAKAWIYVNIQTALYVYARFLDLEKTFNEVMLATNTKFSNQVIQYAEGVGIKLMGWSYPKGESLENNIEKFKLYPITMIPSLDKKTIDICLKNKLLLIEQLVELNEDKISRLFKIDQARAMKILEQAKILCYK